MKEHTEAKNITLRPEQMRKLKWLQKYYSEREYSDWNHSAIIRRLIDQEYSALHAGNGKVY